MDDFDFLTLSIVDAFLAVVSTGTGQFWWEIQMLSAFAEGRYC